MDGKAKLFDDDDDDDPPILSNIESNDLSYIAGSGKARITNNLEVSDKDSKSLRSATIRISSGYNASEDLLIFSNQDKISGNWNKSEGILTLKGRSSVDNYQSALRNIRYENSNSVNPSNIKRTITFMVNDGNEKSNVIGRNIFIAATNKAPKLSGIESDPVVYCVSSLTTPVTSTLAVSDADNANLTSATIQISPYSPAGMLRFTDQNGIRGSWDSSTGKLTLTGQASVSNYQVALRSIRYKNDNFAHSLTVNYDISFNVSDGSHFSNIITRSINLKPTPVVRISGLDPSYYKEDALLVPLYGTPAGGTFSGPGLLFSDQNWYFIPRNAPLGKLNIVYSYQEFPGACFGYDTAAVQVLEARAYIDFPDDRKDFCKNESSFTIKGVTKTNSIGNFYISDGIGLTDNRDNTATIIPSLLEQKEYSIVYTYLAGKTQTITEQIIIRNSPKADFQWETECFEPGQTIKFHNTSVSTLGDITSSVWKIHTASGIDSINSHELEYTFGSVGNHKIELQIQTSYGCTGDIAKVYGLKPIIELADKTYFESYDNPSLNNWQSYSSVSSTVNNWTLGDPSIGFSGASSGSYCWYTNIPAGGSPPEQSVVISPCFDFRGTERPMLILDIWRLFHPFSDGANLQFTVDNGKTWTLLGHLEDGVNWYNHDKIPGNPGGYPVGWSVNMSGTGNDNAWIQARHSLEMLAGKKPVQLRIAYGSDGRAYNSYGFAFDNIRIAEQNRNVLIEHFTNSSDDSSKVADLALNKMVNADSISIIDLQYHTSFPGEDPFNKQEPYVPGARALYYGLPKVPYSILNGGSKPENRFDYDNHPLDANIVNAEALDDSKFKIGILSDLNGTTLDILTEIVAEKDMPVSEFTLQVAIIERKITGLTGKNGATVFESVVKALLPDAAGTTVFKDWTTGEKYSITNWWTLQNIYNLGELRIVSFIQDESTGQIYQAAISPLGIGTSDHEIPAGPILNFIVFPNPASEKVFIHFEKPLARDVNLEIYNNLGSMVYASNVKKGEKEKVINTGSYPNGLYIIRMVNPEQVLGSRKVTLSR